MLYTNTKCIRSTFEFIWFRFYLFVVFFVLLNLVLGMRERDSDKQKKTTHKTNETVFQMFTSSEVAVGLTSKVFKEILKLEEKTNWAKKSIQKKFTFNKRDARIEHCIESQTLAYLWVELLISVFVSFIISFDSPCSVPIVAFSGSIHTDTYYIRVFIPSHSTDYETMIVRFFAYTH